MSDTEKYKFYRPDFRCVLKLNCDELFKDKELSEMVYMKLMRPLEDFFDDHEVFRAQRKWKPKE